jgi:hypothetical protein
MFANENNGSLFRGSCGCFAAANAACLRLVSIAVVLVAMLWLTASAVIAADAAPSPSPTPGGVDFGRIWDSLSQPSFWVVLLVALVAGALGGIVYELLLLKGDVELPHRPALGETPEGFRGTNIVLYNLGIAAPVIIGALAALATFFVLSPASAFALLAQSVIAGSAGTSVFRTLQMRLDAALAQKDAADTRATAGKARKKLQAARELSAQLRSAQPYLRLAIDRYQTAPETAGLSPPDLDLAKLERLDALLGEAEGLHEAI